MSVLARDDKQYTLIYSSNTRLGKHTLSYLTPVRNNLLAINIAETKVADTVWAELAEALGKKVGDLVDKRMVKADDTSEFSTDDWLKILQNDNEVLSNPIAINGTKTMQIQNPTDVIAFFGVDSAGLEKTVHTEKPVIKPEGK
ncbi:arsenate reductase family protein [Jejudonia soesokkakensis]|uniref:Arsenate reductase family protein n=1 Tax=Jejudonia soesokkakensis TaxID=1323432 RepID=A0ABW2MU30_9FLAO